MSNITDTDKIDAIGVVHKTEKIKLKIFDHLEWGNEAEHIILLQDKINNYLTFIESGQIYEIYPDTQNKEKIISIDLLHLPSTNALKFLDTASKIIDDSGYKLVYSISEARNDVKDIDFSNVLLDKEKVMSIDEISIDKETDMVYLRIFDDMDWTDEHKHLYTLQCRINTYLKFAETKEVSDAYPNVRKGQFAIFIEFSHEPTPQALEFVSQVRAFVRDYGYQLAYKY